MAEVEFKRFKQTLKTQGYFVTRPRMRLFGLLQNHPALTFKDLVGKVEKHDQSTVYRNMDLFEKLGIIHRIKLGWQYRIELTDKFHRHHHHLSCLDCGIILVLKDESRIESEIERICKMADFVASDHQLEIRGYCKSCNNKHKSPE
ncbi:MAG: transcriptional repressor [bacterium]|nr:transcriptional repressor [bacterium]